MRLPVKFAGGLLLFIILLFGGCTLLMRGCLSAYDERYATSPVFFFEKDTSHILLALVTFEKTTSYSRSGGMTHKSVSTSYHLQTNNAVTGVKLLEKKIADHSDIKQYPVKMLASSGGVAWLFINELQAYNPFTLDKVADISILETKNPILKGRFPKESQYYKYSQRSNCFYITATDGSQWKLDTKTLLAKEVESIEEQEPFTAEIKEIERQEKQNNAASDSLYRQNMPSAAYYKVRENLYRQRDSLQNIKSLLRKKKDVEMSLLRKKNDLWDGSFSYNSLLVNEDTTASHWFGLMTSDEFEKTYNRFEYRSQYGETSRRKLWMSPYAQKPDGDILFTKDSAAALQSTKTFLAAGFLLNKETALPFTTNGAWLVLHKSQIGNDGKIQVSCVNKAGTVLWTADTQLKEWQDYICTEKYLYVLGSNQKELSSSQANALWIVDLRTGKMTGYDYFTDKTAATPSP